MSADHVLPASGRRRPATLLLALGCVLGLTAPVVVAGPASAQPTARAADNPLCYAGGWSEVPAGRLWTRIGARSNSGYAYQYWMVEWRSSSGLYYYESSVVAKCSGDSLVSSFTIGSTDGTGLTACTSPGDYSVGGYRERFVGQRVARFGSPVVLTYTFRYWHREAQLIVNPLQWSYVSSSVVQCL
jgi:hypothetical protein